MKSSITTLAIAFFALGLPVQQLLAQGGDQPTVVAATYAPAGEAEEEPEAPVFRLPVRPASAPLWASQPPMGYPVAPATYGGAVAHSGKGGKKGGVGCPCPQCMRGRRFSGSWGSVDYMYMWLKGRDLPPLATTSPVGTLPANAAVLPTQILFGNGRIGEDAQPSGRFDFGLWLDDCESNGVGVRMFGIEGDSTRFDAASQGTPILGVPFFNVDLNQEDAVEVAIPGLFSGSIHHRTANDLLMGELYGRMTFARGCGYRLDMIGGYHVVRLDDSIGISSSTEFLAGGVFPLGTVVDIYDTFKARNEMHGGEIGFISELNQGPWSLKGLLKVTIANTHQTVTINGQTDVYQGGPPVIINSGTFAQASNIGSYERDKLTYIPEAALTLGYDVTPCVKLTAGYTFIYFPHVLLAGDQIDRNISPTQVTPLPAFSFRETDQWAQGMSFGVEWNY